MVGDGETAIAEPVVREGAGLLVRATVWTGEGDPRECDPGEAPPATGIRWFDVRSTAGPEALFGRLESVCDGLKLEMLVDLVKPDELPENRSWHGGRVRLASTFAVYPGIAGRTDWTRYVKPSAEVVYQQVELLAGDDWLISVWHDARRYCGKDPTDDIRPPIGRADVFEGMVRKWRSTGGGNAGDLGVLAMHELALTYAPAHRHFRVALEEWELGLYGSAGQMASTVVDTEQERELLQLWYARARFRDWLSPLNLIGVNEDVEKAWLPASDHDQVKAVDRRIDKSLAALATLGNTLRDSFHLLFIKASEAQRERHERQQRRIELIAAGFLVPTFIVGFFGANTWVPGEHRHWGLTLMLVAMLALTCVVMVLLLATRRGRGARLQRLDRGAR